MAFKIYTKTGDKGYTSLYGGLKIPKYHIRVETYGTIDELNAFLGTLTAGELEDEIKQLVLSIQHQLFILGSHIATDPGETSLPLPTWPENATRDLEQQIDHWDAILPPLKNFILPGGTPAAAQCHVARCVCRRAERMLTLLASQESVPDFSIVFLNRLSDYLFVLARYINFYNQKEDIKWINR